MQVPIEDIIVKKRIRQDMGNIDALADSMRRLGQISPIAITKNNVLIAGGRRLEAARALGWRTINAIIVEIPDTASKLEYEIEENIQRQDFTSEEITEASKQLNKLKHPGFFRRIWMAIVRFFKKLFKIED
ncbi:ParB N-terminal domain-containing protein [Breznakiella homolactica]|uniref:ParB N-terminal domain-containing protein n=1 Tax=Breznakiella homolactica TaxID=2798577 RepID=A0A7T7XR46_9SPIR|nr:ParB N-terminal domain-containing protein [Breznakiella homolactica]QQO10965.1 ParB N-terminal domain-containing protein [Breznakiella homolactica]